jgi:hypothetical protein
MISKKAIDLIKEFENDPEDYESRPEWPGEKSGITIGFGWDLGYTEWQVTAKAWKQLEANTLSALLSVSGLKGEVAKNNLYRVVHLEIPYRIAEAVFFEHTIPTWEARTLSIYPQASELNGDCLGALVSLVFNRGTSLSLNDRRIEMRSIQAALMSKNYSEVPKLIKAMKRLWPDSDGLKRRRDAEATLFAGGLAEMED